MAERRMFAKTIIDSDAFLDMPQSSQLLYFHLSMRADDDGFINNPKSIMRNVGCKDDDIKLLIVKKFLIPFDSGVVVIKHWKIHNYIRNDRYKETKYKEERASLTIDENNSYSLGMSSGIPVVSKMDTQVRLGEVSIGKSNNNTQKSKLFALVDSYSDDETITNLLHDWMDIRKAKRSAQTEKAIKQNLDRLADYAKESKMSLSEYLSEVVRRGWAAFYPIKNFEKAEPKQETSASYDLDEFEERSLHGELKYRKKGNNNG